MEAPENTLQSFLHSVQHGVDIIECDVRITKDGEIIVAHDADFQRMCDTDRLPSKGQKMRDTEYKELPTFKKEIPITFCSDDQIVYKLKPGDQNYFSKLDDVLQMIPKD